MSLARTALRIATVMALSNGYAEPWPTLAQGRVFDSRVDPRQIIDLDDVVPIIEVCTDDDRGKSLSENNGGPPFEHEVTLAIELSLGMWTGEGDARLLGLPQSEPELDAMLDLMEMQVKRALVDFANPWSERLIGICRRITDWSSQRYVERDGNVRLAARSLSMTVALPFEPLSAVVTGSAPAAAIPEPLGSLLTAIVASDSPYAHDATALQTMLLAGGASKTVVLPALTRVRFIEAAQAETDDDDTPRGPRPDGVAEATLPTS